MTDLAKPDGGHLRVADADRERIATWLREAAGRGELTLAEADERQARAYAAVTRADLDPLTADLPTPAVAAQETPRPDRRILYLVLVAVALALVAAVVAGIATGHAVLPVPIFWIAFFGFMRFRHHGPRPPHQRHHHGRA